MIEAIGVVVPVRNEELLLPACLDSLAEAAAAVPWVRLHVVVVLDGCTDSSAAVVDSWPSLATALTVDAGNVGVARAAGMARVLEHEASCPRERLWLATTDADGTVPKDWLSGQLRYEDEGADVVVGTVRVADWCGHPAAVPRRFALLYATAAAPGHEHVHGANLGVRASTYEQAGGIAPLALAEDHAFVAACVQGGAVVARVADLPVTTSARHQGRAAGGFADLLARLATESEAS